MQTLNLTLIAAPSQPGSSLTKVGTGTLQFPTASMPQTREHILLARQVN